jgi:DNA-binding NtrC family response regulator
MSGPEASDPAERAVRRLRQAQSIDAIVGDAPALTRVLQQLARIAHHDATVLVTGETGTGKELVSRAIHYMSRRQGSPFVAVNCAALPDTLLEDELFGHAAGAFTDARAARCGLLSQAEGGTVLLDEIESLTARGQSVLLRVLQDKTVRPLGSNAERHLNVRFIAATNTGLRSLVERGVFRADLYYRLRVLWLDLPALRDRREDILPLAEHFVLKHTPAADAPPRLSAAACCALLATEWPGNVRELENTIIRALSLVDGGSIEPEHLGLAVAGDPAADAAAQGGACGLSFREQKLRAIRAFEYEYLTRLIHDHGGNITRAAKAAGKERRELGKLLKKHHLTAHSDRDQ